LGSRPIRRAGSTFNWPVSTCSCNSGHNIRERAGHVRALPGAQQHPPAAVHDELRAVAVPLRLRRDFWGQGRAIDSPGQALLKPLERKPAGLAHHQLAIQAGVRRQLGRISGNEPVMSVPWRERSSRPPVCTASWAR
jgi:hypothetical protein